MKRVLMTVVLLVVAAGTALYLFRDPLSAAIAQRLTADMFVPQDADGFYPGPSIGSPFPPIRASHAGGTVTSIDSFMGPRGLILFANRSVEW